MHIGQIVAGDPLGCTPLGIHNGGPTGSASSKKNENLVFMIRQSLFADVHDNLGDFVVIVIIPLYFLGKLIK